MSNDALVPIEQRTVLFYDDEITAVLVEVDSHQVVYVPIRLVCDFLGVTWNAQFERINRDPVLSEVGRTVRVTRTEGTRQVSRELFCLPLTFLNGWLFGINANRVKEEIRDRLLRYQKECYEVLANAFLTRSTETAVSSTEASLVQVREMALAIARLAEEQIEFDRRLVSTETRLDKAASIVGDMQKRLTAVEQKLTPGTAVTDEQAMQISQAVKAIAMVMEKQSGRNEFQGVYGELYRRFGITSYKLLPAEKFADAMDFLTERYVNLTGSEDVPF